MSKTRTLLVCCALTAGTAATLPAAAADAPAFPTKPMRLLVGFVPGGFTDLSGRMVGQGLGDAFGMQVVVDNRPGANGAIAAGLTSQATPDGYTFYMASPGHVTNPILRPSTPFHPLKDFTPLSLFAEIPNVLVVPAAFPAQDLAAFLALARERSRSLTQGSSGVGSPGHLIGALLQGLVGAKFTHVPYKGSGALYTDLISGQVDFSFPSTASARAHVGAGRLRALGVTGAKRSSAYPDVPTFAEAGVSGFSVVGWYGVVGPAGMPADVTARLSGQIMRVAQDPEIRARLVKAGADPVGSDAKAFGDYIAAEYARWSKVIREANIRPE